jgi:CRP/FNR family transcriptional regulator, cyclic AMP receptor protein
VLRPRAVTDLVSVLDKDPALAELVPAKRLPQARQAAAAVGLRLEPGSWAATDHADRARGGYGLLVIDGLLIRRVGVDGRFGAELLGPWDLLRPWQHDGEGAGGTLPFETAWRIVAPTHLAVLDLRWAARMTPWPQVGAELAGRALERSLRLVATMAIVQQPKLDNRLWLLFWELADRYGRVHRDGVHIDLPLTHEVLSHLAAARRPSVSGALARLVADGKVRRDGRTWVLTGQPPAGLRAAVG